MAKKQEKVVVPEKPQWEIKDRSYVLIDQAPLGYHLRTQNVFVFDEEKGYEREITYSRNQRTIFVDEMKGDIRPAHVWFRDGYLFVPKTNVTLQKLLAAHPSKDKVYYEVDNQAIAEDTIDLLELELEAMTLASSMDIDHAEAVLRSEVGSTVSKMSSKEIKRDLLLFARTKPVLFLELASDDSLQLRNIGIRAVERKIITLSNDQRTFNWGETGRKLMNVPFDENPYSALSSWFKTDEGLDVLKSVEKRLNS